MKVVILLCSPVALIYSCVPNYNECSWNWKH